MKSINLIKRKIVVFIEGNYPFLAVMLRARMQLITGEQELKYLKYLVDRDKPAIDVGANNGVYSYWFLRYASKTIACEPHPSLVEYLHSAFGDRIQIVNAALSDVQGEVTLSVPEYKGAEQNYRGSVQSETVSGFKATNEYLVKMVTLDEIAPKNVGFIKIDVEGHEQSVLRGASNVLTNSRPVILVEAEEKHCKNAVRDVGEYLSRFKYKGYFCVDREFYPIDSFEIGVHKNSNFVFLPNEKKIHLIESSLADPV